MIFSTQFTCLRFHTQGGHPSGELQIVDSGPRLLGLQYCLFHLSVGPWVSYIIVLSLSFPRPTPWGLVRVKGVICVRCVVWCLAQGVSTRDLVSATRSWIQGLSLSKPHLESSDF